jgi:hypothetical protein
MFATYLPIVLQQHQRATSHLIDRGGLDGAKAMPVILSGA